MVKVPDHERRIDDEVTEVPGEGGRGASTNRGRSALSNQNGGIFGR